MDYNEVFREARSDLKEHFGLELTLIELARLRQYVKPVVDVLGRTKKRSDCRYDAAPECVFRFLHDYYGIRPEAVQSYVLVHFHHEFMDYLKIVQEKSHLP